MSPLGDTWILYHPDNKDNIKTGVSGLTRFKRRDNLYAGGLVPIAGFYLAFTAYFRDQDAWQLEVTAVAVFAVFGLVGVRVPFAVIIGYLLHIPWDAVHEFNAHAGGSLLVPRQITSVPLGYGFFCATYDFLMATYFYTRRNQWRATRRASLRDG